MAFKEYPAQNRYMTQSFKGLNCHERTGDGEWTDMLNLTADEYPVEKTRAKRTKLTCSGTANITSYSYVMKQDYRTNTKEYYTLLTLDSTDELPDPPYAIRYAGDSYDIRELDEGKLKAPAGMFNVLLQKMTLEGITEIRFASYMTAGMPVAAAVIDEALYLVTEDGYITRDGESTALGLNATQLVPIGRRLVTNNGYMVNDDLTDVQNAYVTFTVENADFTLCDAEAAAITYATSKPANPSNGDYYYDANTKGLYRWSDAQELWISAVESYSKIEVGSDNKDAAAKLKAGDAVKLKGETIDSAFIVERVDAGENDTVLVLRGIITDAPQNVVFTRRMPVLDYICEHNNRIWGCRYGTNDEGEFVNEIYTCALGDPLNWMNYEGTAADAWTTSVGEPGPWTGCCECGRYVLFFKEDKVFIINGDEPANFGYEALDDWGVQAGSSKSITVIDNYVYYKSQHGVMRIGVHSYPVCISRALGYDRWTQAVGGTDGRKYYLSMADGDTRSLYVYDTETGIWTRENEPVTDLVTTVRYKNNLMAIGAEKSDVPYFVKISYDEELSRQKKATDGNMWIVRDMASQVIAKATAAQIQAAANEDELDDIIDYYEDQRDNGTLYIKVETIYDAYLDYVYLNAERPRDMKIPNNLYGYQDEDDFAWNAETGPLALDLPDEKRIRTVQIRLKSGENARLNVYAAYDESENWTRILLENTGRKGTFKIDWTPEERCGSFRLRFAGIGETVIYSITIETEDAGENVR